MARLDVQRALLQVQREQAEPIPNVTVQGGYQYQQNTPHGQALVGVYVDIPLWNRNQGKIMAASAAAHRSAAQRDAVQNDLTKQLADALSRYRAANQSIENYRNRILPDAARTLDLVQAACGNGVVDITRLLQAQRSYFETNISYIGALEERLIAAAEIAGLLQLEEFPPPVPLPPPAMNGSWTCEAMPASAMALATCER